MTNLKTFRGNMLIGMYQEVLVIKNTAIEDCGEDILYKGYFQDIPSEIELLDVTYIRTNENFPDTIILEVKYNESQRLL